MLNNFNDSSVRSSKPNQAIVSWYRVCYNLDFLLNLSFFKLIVYKDKPWLDVRLRYLASILAAAYSFQFWFYHDLAEGCVRPIIRVPSSWLKTNTRKTLIGQDTDSIGRSSLKLYRMYALNPCWRPEPTRQCVDPLARKLPLDRPANSPGNSSSFANFPKNREALLFEILHRGVGTLYRTEGQIAEY